MYLVSSQPLQAATREVWTTEDDKTTAKERTKPMQRSVCCINHTISGLALATALAVGLTTARMPTAAHADGGPGMMIRGYQDQIWVQGSGFPQYATVTMDVYGSHDNPLTAPNPSWAKIGSTSGTAGSDCNGVYGPCTPGLVVSGLSQGSSPCDNGGGFQYVKVEAYFNYPDAQPGMLAYSLFPVTAVRYVDCSPLLSLPTPTIWLTPYQEPCPDGYRCADVYQPQVQVNGDHFTFGGPVWIGFSRTDFGARTFTYSALATWNAGLAEGSFTTRTALYACSWDQANYYVQAYDWATESWSNRVSVCVKG